MYPTFALLVLATAAVSAYQPADEVMQTLMANYGASSIRPKLAIPGAASATAPPEVVDVQFYVAQLRPLDMLSQTYGFDGYMRAWWNDQRLVYNGTSDGGGFDNLNLGLAERQAIWRPEFYWEGARSITMPSPDLGTGELMWVSPNGDVWWSRQVSFVMSCAFANGKNLDALPFDTQHCRFTIGMYSQTAAEVYVRWARMADGVSEKTALANWQGACLAEWHATKLTQESELQVYVSSNYTYAHATLDFTRAPAVWLWSYFMPAVVLSGLSYLGFFIDPAATPARVALGMLTVLVVMTLFISLTDKLPPTVGLPWLARFMLYSFFFNVVAMCEQVLVSFGTSLKKWLNAQNKELAAHTTWQEALVQNRKAVTDLFDEWDANSNRRLDKAEFRRGIRTMGLHAPLTELNHVFDAIDTNGDGEIDHDEIDTWIARLESGMRRSRKATLYGVSGSKEAKDDDDDDELDDLEGNGFHPPPAVAPLAHRSVPPNGVVPNGAAARGTPASLQPQEQGRPDHAAATTTSSIAASVAMPPFEARDAVAARPPGNERQRRMNAEKVATEAIRQTFMTAARVDLDKGLWWKLKTFTIFPILDRLRFLDFVFRVAFPVVYIIFVNAMLAEVDYFGPHYKLLETAPCYNEAVG